VSWGPGGAGRAARGQLAAGENAGDRRRAALQRNREGEQEEEDEDLFINFAKVQGVHCNVKFLSNYSSNKNIPKIISVELKKIYHFALGSNFKRVRVLKLFLKANKSFNFK
jgi:hypothetical protein